ncbi:hypothetical protein R1sor_020164 [Riccia sorocarpa]|uniref:OTU domain-containing protein n=1 Tax=Riccia sorocarpa TaxID=122646 RepID=A0ABD3IHC3_9MARC
MDTETELPESKTSDAVGTTTGDGSVVKETRSEMLARHQKEIKELQGKEIGLKKAAAKGSKAEQKAKKKLAEEEIARLDSKLKARHVKELASLGIPVDDKEVNTIEMKVKAIAGVSLNGPNASHKPSKGQKWRDRRAQQEAEREQRIQEEQNNIVSQRVLEEQQLEGKLGPLGFTLKEIKSDGHCLYRAVEDQIALHPELVQYSYQELRRLAANYMRTHAEDFMPFIGAESAESAESDKLEDTSQTKFQRYCEEVESTAAWGGQLELGALSHALQKHIVVHSANLPDVEMGKEYKEDGLDGAPVLNPSIRVSYHRHAFGLGEHYNSVVPVDPASVQDTVKA